MAPDSWKLRPTKLRSPTGGVAAAWQPHREQGLVESLALVLPSWWVEFGPNHILRSRGNPLCGDPPLSTFALCTWKHQHADRHRPGRHAPKGSCILHWGRGTENGPGTASVRAKQGLGWSRIVTTWTEC